MAKKIIRPPYYDMLDDFAVWAQTPASGLNGGKGLSLNSVNQYKTYLNYAIDRIEIIVTNHAKGGINTPSVYKVIKSGNPHYLNVVGALISANNYLFALTLVRIVKELAKLCRDHMNRIGLVPKNNTDAKNINDSHSALCALEVFLQQNTSLCWPSLNGWNPTAVDNVCNKIKKPEINKIDGNDCLLSILSTAGFIKLAIENSYFFDPNDVNNRHTDIVSMINNNNILEARWSEDATLYTNPNPSIPLTKKEALKYPIIYYNTASSTKIKVHIDSDGNKAVRSLINNVTGYTISAGVDSIFQSYKISHIWGDAFDPRNFTSLWNLVLVPAWANDILDKDASSPNASPIIKAFKDAIKAICIDHYKMKTLNWSIMDNGTCPSTGYKSSKKTTYTINVIGNKAKGTNGLGKITKVKIIV